MLNFIIVDDNDLHRRRVKENILQYMMKNKIEFSINEYSDYTDKLIEDIKNTKNDFALFLDLELPNGNGLDIARYVRNDLNDWKSPIIIFSAYVSLAFEVYKQKLQILDFIGKTIEIDKNIREALDIYMKMINKDSFYKFRYKNVDYCLSYDEIDYIQREGRKTLIVTKNDNYYLNVSVNKLKKNLPRNFVISSKGTILNINNVSKIDWNEMLVFFKDNKKDYIVSRNHKKELNEYGNI